MALMDGIAALLWADAAFKAASPGGIAEISVQETGVRPATEYRDVFVKQDVTLDGRAIDSPRMQFTFHAKDAAGARMARDAARAVLDEFHGVLLDGTVVLWTDWLGGEAGRDANSREFFYRADCRFKV